MHSESLTTNNETIWLQSLVNERVSPDLFVYQDIKCNWVIQPFDCFTAITIQSFSEIWDKKSTFIPCSKIDHIYFENAHLKVDNLPLPGMAQPPNSLIIRARSGYFITYDILGMALWAMTRKEELYASDSLDSHGRFPAHSSHAFLHNYLERPIVDEWFIVITKIAKHLWPQLKFAKSKFQIQTSHDVDNPSKYGFINLQKLLFTMAVDLIKRKKYLSTINGPTNWLLERNNPLSEHDPYNTFSWLMDVSEKNDLISTFYFICGKTHPKYDCDYKINDLHIRKLLREISARGHKIGLHPSYNAYLDTDIVLKELWNLREVCMEEGIDVSPTWNRMHFLRWKTSDTLRVLERAGINHDCTLGYADMPGFRCGTCFEYQAFDPVLSTPVNLRIQPLIAMDVSVMASRYLGLGTSTEAYKKFTKLKNACKQVNGIFTLLWHNSSLVEVSERNLYSQIILN